MAKFLILSIDGGGIRGAFAARLIELIDHDFHLLKRVNLLAGTSTGSIIASCLALKFPPTRIVSLYRAAGKDIFAKQFFFGPRILEKVLKSSYDKLRFKAILRQVYGKTPLGLVQIPLLMPATDLQKSQGFLFKSYESEFSTLPIYEAVLASCAAPTYFDPSLLHGKLLADGGMWGNNPSIVALGDAKFHFKVKEEDIMILSVGTGHFTNGFDENATSWGLINGWKIRNLTEFISSLQSQATYETLSCILKSEQILRLNFSQDELMLIDDFSNLEKLIAKADVVYKNQKEALASFFDNFRSCD